MNDREKRGRYARMFFSVSEGIEFALKYQYFIRIDNEHAVFLKETLDKSVIYNIFDGILPLNLVKRLVYDTGFKEYKQKTVSDSRADSSRRNNSNSLVNPFRRDTRGDRWRFNRRWRQR